MEWSDSDTESMITGDESFQFSNFSHDIIHNIFCFLDCCQLAKCLSIATFVEPIILRAMRSIFEDEFGVYAENVSKRTLTWALRRLHKMDMKSAADLFFWSSERGYTKFILRVIAGNGIPQFKGGLNVTSSKKDGMSAVHFACRYNQLEALHLLMAADKVNMNKLTKSGKHPLIFAIEHNRLNLLNTLLANPHTRPNAVDHEGVSVLCKACGLGNPNIVQAMLLALADPNLADKERKTALFNACESGSWSVVKLLLTHPDVNIESGSKSGKSPLYIAAEKGHTEVVRLLLAKGANPRKQTCRKKIPLYAAAELGNADLVMELLPYTLEEDLFKLTHFGTTPMHAATTNPDKRVKKLFMAFCRDPVKSREEAKQIATQRRRILEGTDDDVKRRALKELDQALLRRTTRNRVDRAGTPRFVEHLEKFRDHHRTRALKAYQEQERRKLLMKRVKEKNNQVRSLEVEEDIEQGDSVWHFKPRPQSAGSIRKDDNTLQCAIMDMIKSVDRESVRQHLMSEQHASSAKIIPGRPQTARRFPLDRKVEHVLKCESERQETQNPNKKKPQLSGKKYGLRKKNVVRVDPLVRCMDRYPMANERVRANAKQMQPIAKPMDYVRGITVQQAQLFQQRQSDRIAQAHERALAKIAKERERAKNKEAIVKRQRLRARMAALRIISNPVTASARKPEILNHRAESTEKLPLMRSKSCSQNSSFEKSLPNKDNTLESRHYRFTKEHAQSPVLSDYEPMVATIEHDLNDAQVLIDDIKSNLKKATQPKQGFKMESFAGSRRKLVGGAHLSSKVNDKLERMSRKALKRTSVSKKAIKLPKVLNSRSQLTKNSLEKLKFIEARKKQNLSENASSTIPTSLQSSAGTSNEITPKWHEFDKPDLGYNADEYMTEKQKLMTDNSKLTVISNSFRDISISSTPLENPSEANLVSTPLLEVERLEKLADELATTCRKRGEFAVWGKELKRSERSSWQFDNEEKLASHSRKKEMLKQFLRKRFDQLSESLSPVQKEKHDILPTTTTRNEKISRLAKRRRRRRRLENAYGVKLEKLKPRKKSLLHPPRPKKRRSYELDSPSKLFVTGGALF